MIAVFGRVSDQDAIGRLRRRMTGDALGILLHVSRPGAVMRFVGRLLADNSAYLWHVLRPLLVLAFPFALLWGQLEARYATVDLAEGIDPVTVTLRWIEAPSRSAMTPSGTRIAIDGPVMRIDTLRQTSFRIVALPGHPRSLTAGGVSFPVGRTGDWNGSVISRGFLSGRPIERLFKPWLTGVRAVPGGPSAGWLVLPPAGYGVLGGHWSWIAVFLVFSSLSALAGARLFRVRI